MKRSSVLFAGVFALGGCTSMLDRLDNVGRAPDLAPIENPVLTPNYRPVSLPMPTPEVVQPRHANSLWRTGARAFFRDQRASRVGDLLTVTIDISDTATLDNKTERLRQNTDDASIGALLGYETSMSRILPEAINPGNLLDIDSATKNTGQGTVERKETIKLTVAAVVTQVLPNDNLVIYARQEVRVNFEVRELFVSGIVRPEDISNSNIVSHDKIAEARIAYGGRGQITDVQQPRYGSQVLDILMPF